MKKLAEKYQLSEDAISKVFDVQRDTSVSDYVWLPLRFEEPSEEHPYGMVYLDWMDEWKLEDFE